LGQQTDGNKQSGWPAPNVAGKNVLFVGHGGVGTLLFCALSGIEISRQYDQGAGGGGCWFEFSITGRKPLSGWQPMEALMIESRGKALSEEDTLP
jgi:broad specificity phosphatase PhoE